MATSMCAAEPVPVALTPKFTVAPPAGTVRYVPRDPVWLNDVLEVPSDLYAKLLPVSEVWALVGAIGTKTMATQEMADQIIRREQNSRSIQNVSARLVKDCAKWLFISAPLRSKRRDHARR